MAKQKSRAAKVKSKLKHRKKIAGKLPGQKAIRPKPKRKIAGRRRLPIPKIKQETFTLPAPAPREFQSARIAPPEEPQTHVLSHPARTAVKHHPKKDAIPAPLTAMVGAIIVTALVAAFLMLVLGMNPLYTIGISMAIFVGFSIVFYTIIETAE